MSFCKTLLKLKSSQNYLFVPVRNKRGRWLGYYQRKIPQPMYEERIRDYRERVLQPLETMPSLEQRLKEVNVEDPVFDAKIDIGLPTLDVKGRIPIKERLEWQKNIKKNKELEKEARSKMLKIDLKKVKQDWQTSLDGVRQLHNIADHYGIFSDMFDHGYFTPRIALNVFYPQTDDHILPVCMGNILESIQAEKAPDVVFDSDPNDMWSLVLTNIDGHLLDTKSEYLLWFVGNIKGNDITTGEIVMDYLRPFPMRGTGYHRNVFILYKQDGKIDYSSLKKKSPCLSLKDRTFKTFDFYKERQDSLTPAGLSFFQCVWDKSLTHFFHHVLDMREPSYEYNEWKEYIKPQVHYPHKQPFNLYLDQYRDPKEINKEVLLKRLAVVHPLKKEPPMPKYPCLHRPEGRVWSWLKEDIRNERLRLGKYRGLRPASAFPQEDNQGSYRRKA